MIFCTFLVRVFFTLQHCWVPLCYRLLYKQRMVMFVVTPFLLLSKLTRCHRNFFPLSKPVLFGWGFFPLFSRIWHSPHKHQVIWMAFTSLLATHAYSFTWPSHSWVSLHRLQPLFHCTHTQTLVAVVLSLAVPAPSSTPAVWPAAVALCCLETSSSQLF